MRVVNKEDKKILVKKVVIIIIFILLLCIIASPYFFISIKLVGKEKMTLNYGEKYSEPGYRAYLFNQNITDRVIILNNISDAIGKYKIIYSYKFLFYNIKKERIIYVEDLSGPIIELNGDKNFEVTINTSYEEPGYKAIDNLDGDVTDKVKVSNNVNINVLGLYQVEYEVYDKAGNKSTIVRNVNVEKKRPTQMSVSEYSLNGWYEETKLKETKDYGDTYFNEITMVGDSNTMNMYLSKNLSGIRAWAVPCLHAESMHSKNINLYGLGTQMKLIDAIEKYKPKMLILNFGTFSTAWINENTFLENANSIIENIKSKSPDTKIILISIYPIAKGDNINKFNQETINKYNFLILEMANKHNLKYLDVQEVLKGSDGYIKKEYVIDDKFHLTNLGHQIVKKYIKTHAWEE